MRAERLTEEFSEYSRSEIELYRIGLSNYVCIKQLAGHLTLKHDICFSGRDHKLSAERLAVVFLNGGRCDAIAAFGIWKKYFTASALRRKINGCLYRGGIIGDTVTLCAKSKTLSPNEHIMISLSLYIFWRYYSI